MNEMRYHEIASTVQLPVSQEEQGVLDQASKDGGVRRDELDEREAEIARRMVSRGLLHRHRSKHGTHFTASTIKDIWRSR